MRTTRARTVLACVAAVVSVAVVVPPIAAAATKPATSRKKEARQDRTLKSHRTAINKANFNIQILQAGAATLAADLAGAKTTLGTLQTLATGLPPILTQLGTGLTAINTALQDPTTGLVGLNLARPQFGAFNAAGVIQGGTGQVTGGSGPKANAVKGSSGPPDIDGLYVVDFGNDVSKRVYSVNVFPLGPTSLGGGGTTPTGEALNCAASVTASAICGAVEGVSSDTSPSHVLVQIGDGSSGGAPNGFSVTAFSG